MRMWRRSEAPPIPPPRRGASAVVEGSESGDFVNHPVLGVEAADFAAKSRTAEVVAVAVRVL